MWNKIFIRSRIENYFRDDVSFGEDLIFNIQYLAQCNKILFIEASPFFHTKDNNDSIVIRFRRRRLLDIENVWRVIDEFVANNPMKINQKYFRDIIEYVRMLFLSQEFKREEKICILNEWYKVSRLKRIKLSEYKGSISNKILICLLTKRCYSLINIIVNWRNLLSFDK